MAAAAAAPGDAVSATATAAATTSRFAAACGALSQYVKAAEKARARPAAPVRPLPLMPGADVDQAPEVQEEAEAAQKMTIVYGGRALVLDAVPAEKAADLLRLAASAAAKEPRTSGVRVAAADLPVARKASLQRFMEKRKGRAAARGEPYLRAGAGTDRDDLRLSL